MFDGILNKNKEAKAMVEAEARQTDELRSRDAFAAAQQNDSDYVTPQQQRGDIIRWQQDMTDEIDVLKRRLRGEHWSGEAWVKKTKRVLHEDKEYNIEIPPLANELFIDYVETQVEPFLSRNLINSNLTEKRILQILKDTMNDIADALADGWDQFEIEFTNFDIILRLIKNTITPAAFRALMGWTKKQDSTVIKRIETQQDSIQAQQKKGMFATLTS